MNKLKVLLIADFVKYSNGVQELGLCKAADDLNWDYKVYDFNYHNENVFGTAYDLVIHAVQYGQQQVEIMKRLKQDGCKLQVLYFCDYRHQYEYWDIWKEQATYLDYIFISNKKQINKFEKELKTPTFFLPQAAYIPNDTVPFTGFERDALFIGTYNMSHTYYEKRNELFKKIQTPIIYINGGRAEEKNAIWGRMHQLYKHSKVIVDASSRFNIDGYVSGRFFHAAGYEAATASMRFKGYEDFGYKDGVHKIFFSTAKEFDEKMDYYLNNKEALEKIRVNGYNHTKKYHTYTHRMQELLTKVKLCQK